MDLPSSGRQRYRSGYALTHVVVFLGQNEKGEGEVVHVTNNANFCTPCRVGCCRTGTIKKAAIDDVIDENDQGELKI